MALTSIITMALTSLLVQIYQTFFWSFIARAIFLQSQPNILTKSVNYYSDILLIFPISYDRMNLQPLLPIFVKYWLKTEVKIFQQSWRMASFQTTVLDLMTIFYIFVSALVHLPVGSRLPVLLEEVQFKGATQFFYTFYWKRNSLIINFPLDIFLTASISILFLSFLNCASSRTQLCIFL